MSRLFDSSLLTAEWLILPCEKVETPSARGEVAPVPQLATFTSLAIVALKVLGITSNKDLYLKGLPNPL